MHALICSEISYQNVYLQKHCNVVHLVGLLINKIFPGGSRVRGGARRVVVERVRVRVLVRRGGVLVPARARRRRARRARAALRARRPLPGGVPGHRHRRAAHR